MDDARARRQEDRRKPEPEPPVEFALGDGGSIDLGQLLKVTGVCESGGEAKHVIQSAVVRVNGQVELRRGRTLRAGDVVVTRGRTIRLVA